MRGFKVRLMSCGLLAALVAWAVTWGGHAVNGQPVAAQPVKPGGPGGKDDKKAKDDRSPEDDNLPFAPPYERDARRQLEAARDYLNVMDPTNIKWGDVCGFLQSILDSKSDSFFDVKYTAGGKTHVNRISVKTEANRIIAAFPPEGLQFYQQAQGANAATLLEDAVRANYDIAILADLSQRYFHTRAGAEGTILLATIYLERGNFIEAAYAFERLLPRKDVDDLLTPLTLFKACIAFKRSGDARHTELVKTTLEKLDKVAKGGFQVRRTTYTTEKVRAELERPVDLIRATALVGEWAMRSGNPARAAVVDGGPPFLDAVFKTSLFYSGDDESNLWIKGELDKLFARDGKSPSARSVMLPGAFPVTTGDLLVFRGYDGVYGVATRDRVAGEHVVRAGDVRWRSKTSAGLHQLVEKDQPSDIDMARDVKNWWATYSSRTANVSSIMYENPLIGALAHDGQNVYFVDDLAIPPPPVFSNPNFGIQAGPQFRNSGALANMVRAGRLAAVDLKSGSLKWELGRVEPVTADANAPVPPPALPPCLTEEEADKTTDAFRLCLDAIFLGAPMPINGRLYVLIEQAGCTRLLCLDPKNLVPVPGQTRKPALLWSQKLGKPNSPLPQDSIRRYQGATLAASEGIMVCPTNSGVLVAVDIMSRGLLWVHPYRFVGPPPKADFDPRTGMPIMPRQLPDDRWRAAGPIISGGRVIVTAYDSDKLDCVDLRTGKLLWRVPRDSSDLYVAGVVNDRVLVVGKNSVKAYRLTGEDKATLTPKVAWEPVTIPTPTGHGAIGRNTLFVPVRQETAGRDTTPAGEIWALNIETGQIGAKTAARKRNDTSEIAKYGIGNLVFQDGMVYSQSPWEVACYPQLELKIQEMDKRLAANPKDPVGLLARGELRLDDGKLKEAIADFKEAEKNKLPQEKRPLLREKLYIAYTELFRSDFPAAEPFLTEYEALCEVPADGTETAEDKVRRDDETKRRKRLQYYLLARGREAQGRLGEAFDHYLALAHLGESKQLLDMPDEPNVKMRPDVWARGRIEAMIRRAATAEARRSLEARVHKEWEQVKGGNDLKQLREFVAVFGPYFDDGREAQFKLADALVATNNEADAREAQTHLSQLRVSADDPVVRARATEALAQVMVKSRMMEDAVGLFLQLGKEYPDVVIRDGKTGADFLTALLTDKRLLPFLEPGRYPLPTRVRAEQREGQNSFNAGNRFEIEAPADLFPMFRRYRFALDQFVSGNGSWTLLGFDRVTGSERIRLSNMVAPNLYPSTPNPIPYSKFVQGTGHIMLVQLGMWVYCFDLAEKKELWSKNLLGDSQPAQFQPGINPNPQVEVTADGTCIVRFVDGFILTLGHSTVVQPGHIALLTRDGIECVEPLTRRVLWTRKGIADRTQIHGDAQYIVLLETNDTHKPVSVKLLRAVDGMLVENAPPDAHKVLAEARAYKLFGRTALITSGTGDQPRVLRLYDLATGTDVWRKEFDAKAVPITAPLNPEWTGFVKPDGTAEVYAVKTGELVTKLKIDEKNVEAQMKPCIGAQVLADAERFYLVLDRDPSAGSTNGTRPVQIYNYYMLRSQRVNGPIYAFDRGSGKRLWTYADVLENQWLALEQFNDMPVLIANAAVQRENNQVVHSVVVIEKERGRLVFDKPVVYNGQPFYNLSVDYKNGTINLNRQDMRIYIHPEEAKK